MPPTPLSPWQTAQLSAKTSFPCATVPLPGGSPLPSGLTSISHSAISSGLAGRPKSYASAGEASANAIEPTSSALLVKDIANPPGLVDAPGRLRVVVKKRVGPHRGDEGLPVGLDIALFVGRAADDPGRPAVPGPIHLKARLRLRQHRQIELCLLPAPGAIGRDLDLG